MGNRRFRIKILLYHILLFLGTVSGVADPLAPVQKSVTISREVDLAVEKTLIEPYVNRIRAVHRLGRNLTPVEIREIYAFLHRRPDQEKRLTNLEFNGIKNELVIALMNQSRYPEELTDQLAAMYRQEELGTTWRDYCIQFLGQWYPRMESDRERGLATQAIFLALHERNNGIAGTALIAASGLAGKPGFHPDQLRAIAQSLAADDKVPYITRVPALQISARLGHPDAVATARKLVTARIPAMLKMSALAVLGFKGDGSDMAVLKKYQASSDIRLRAAATAAIHRLNKRI